MAASKTTVYETSRTTRAKPPGPGHFLSQNPSQSIAMIIGYARVSTIEQSLALQVDALKKAGCGKVYEDVASGAQASRPGLADAMQYLRAGDTLAVWRLDRLGRSLSHLCEAATLLDPRKRQQ